jgi:exopolyphosphatase/guanosine-5'-triphosphate,3'-diphosphate pyrophosphatase
VFAAPPRDAAPATPPPVVRQQPSRRDHEEGPFYGALDLGTNNCRLLVAAPRDHGFRVVDAFSRIVRLGEGVGANGRLSEAAMARAIDALKICGA